MSKPALKKRDSSSSREASSKEQSPTKEVSSLVSGVSGSSSGELWTSSVSIWPEWNETEVSAEKWDAAKGAKDSKARKSPLSQFFEDPEGKVKIPAALNVHTWKRPLEHIVDKAPVVVENDSTFDLTSANEHLLSSELMRWFISEIYIVWQVCNRQAGEDNPLSEDATSSPWRPWEHIYSLCKAAKDHVPLYNVYGKYVVRLYWMGCWRKITIDDLLPFDEKNNLLLPATTNQSELWPMLLAKAVLKLASTEVVQNTSRELEDFSIVRCLTGWIPEILPLNPRLKYVEETWEYLKNAIPKFQETEESSEERSPSVDSSATRDSPSESPSPNNGKQEGSGPPPAPQIVVCASFQPLNLQEKKTSMLSQMADASQTLRQYGLCQLSSHSVLLTRTRDCPLVDVLKPPPVLHSKLIRTPNEINITDEPRKVPVERPEQYVRVASPFISFKLASLKIDSKTVSKPVGQRWHACTSNLASFLEAEENEGLDPVQHDVTHNNHDSLDATDTEGTAEDKRKDESVANDADVTDSSLVPEKETTPGQGVHSQEKAMLQETWVHMQDFTKCFQTLLVFHKDTSYHYQFQKSQFKAQDEKVRYFLSVDSLLPTEILICFSALMHWGDSSHEQKDCVPRPGHLGVEPFSWKSIQAQFPLLTINTSSCKAAVLSLPPGRHVLRMHTRVQFGVHVQLYSKTAFVFGEEEEVMPHLEKESLRFCEQALLILRALGGMVRSFSNPNELPSAARTVEEAVRPPSLSKIAVREHWRVFSHAVYHMFCCVLGRKLTSEELFAVQTLTRDATPHSSNTKDTTHGVPEGWSSRQATEQEKQAATILQAGWKGYLVREILNAARPGSEENQKVAKTLLEMWASVESDIETHAVSLLRCMITNNEQLVDLYPCGGDEWTKITFTDYSVPVHETTSSWVLLFREVFHVPKAILLVPKIYSPFRCHLCVVNNDTGEEVPKFFNSVLPFTYTPNKAGYTFVAYTGETSVGGGTWRLRLIGSRELAQLAREGPASNFSVKEFKDYYLPNKKNIICRHAVKVSCAHVATVQFQTSKEDVCIKLSILDHEREVASKTGQGNVVIPVYCFSASDGSCGSAVEKAGVSQSQDGPGGGHEGGRGASECQPAQTHHKYIVQAEVLYNSWPLDDSLSEFIQTLRDRESTEMRVFRHLIEDTPANVEQTSSEAQKLSTSKAAKTKEKEKEKDKPTTKAGSKMEQSVDESKPHWTLRVVSEQSELEQIEVKKDTERLEQIKAMKLAWEAAEPGRAAKAFHTRQQYLKKLRTLGEDYTLDLTPFIRRTSRPERLKDAVMEEEQQRERLEKIQSFRLYRETVLDRRRQEQEQTKQLIKEQRELFERIQEEKAELLRTFDQTREVIRIWKLGEQSQKRGV
ncbi:androglobin [Pangasianodon hypophthalmus]|uniref:androglobin n=1 Tax=Pangasianodon hypophthalmus TaxID=310915 RepID=UPI0023081B22|nr:androglobin [Pangasianodon hypophthalmus]